MSAVLILTPVIIGGWPAISAAVAGAAVALGLTVRTTVKEQQKVANAQEQAVAEQNAVEVEVTNQEILQQVATEQQVVLTRGTIEIRVKRDARGRCTVCASGKGHTKVELKAIAEEFTQRMTQCYAYNRVMTELKTRGFQVVNQEKMDDESVRVHVRRWESD